MKFVTNIGLVVILFACGCSRYERPTYVRSEGAYWVDPPLRTATDRWETTLAKRFETAYPVLKTEICSPGESSHLAARLQGYCELSPPCVRRVSELSAQYTAQSYASAPPNEHLKLLELQSESLRHAESVLPPGLTAAEIEAVLAGSCDDSPTPKLVQTEPLASYFGNLDRDGQCGLDWTYTDRAISVMRTALLDSRSATECSEDLPEG